MQSTPLVTIAITAYERVDLFRMSLASVCRQTYKNLEIYVLDNSNSDDVQNCATEMADGRIRYLRNPPNIRDNIVINHQKAFLPRAGIYHYVLSSDCSLNERTIERMVAALTFDHSICAIASNECWIDPVTGERSSRNPRFASYISSEVPGSHVRLDSRRIIEDAFFGLKGVGVAYHTLMVSDMLTYANLQPMYLSQAHEHHLGLEILMQSPQFGFIREEFLEELINDRRYKGDVFRKHRRFVEALARKQFLEKNYQALLARNFDVTRLQLGLAGLFAKCTYQGHERSFDAAQQFARLTLPLALALLSAPIYLAARLIHDLRRGFRREA